MIVCWRVLSRCGHRLFHHPLAGLHINLLRKLELHAEAAPLGGLLKLLASAGLCTGLRSDSSTCCWISVDVLRLEACQGGG